MIIGSKKWCNYWAKFHQKIADKYAARENNTIGLNFYDIAMYHLFQSYMWRDIKPWN